MFHHADDKALVSPSNDTVRIFSKCENFGLWFNAAKAQLIYFAHSHSCFIPLTSISF